MLEHPSIWQYLFTSHLVCSLCGMESDNLTSADNQQVGWPCAAYPNDHNESPVVTRRVMEWSELHGDMQIEAEMTSRRQFRS
jgi:hypothetical protein